MKFTISKKTIEKHLENVSRALNSTNPFPALTGIMILATESHIQLIVSNGNLSIKETINLTDDSKVEIAGKVLVPGKLFKEIIKKQNESIDISTDDKSIQIVSKGSKVSISLLNIEDYPTISFDSFGKELIIEASALNSLIKNVSFAAAENDKRIILNGVNLAASKGTLTTSATNSFRLAQEKVEIDSNVIFNITILSKNLKDFFPPSIKGKLNIKVDDSKIITSYESSIIVSKLIDGVYPDISRLIPTEYETELKIKTKELLDLIDRATVIAEENSKIVKLTISNNELIIESRRNEIGDSIVKTTNFSSNSTNFSIVFNAIFLKDAVSKFDNEVTLNFSGEYKAFVIKSESNPGVIQLILPHRSF